MLRKITTARCFHWMLGECMLLLTNLENILQILMSRIKTYRYFPQILGDADIFQNTVRGGIVEMILLLLHENMWVLI